MTTPSNQLRVALSALAITLAFVGNGVCEERLNPAKVPRGFSTQIYLDSKGNEHWYVLFVPHAWQPGQRLPSLMFLNGKGENGEDGLRQISNNFGLQIWEMQEYFPFLVVAPQCRANSSWTGANDDSRWAMEILELVVKEFGADPDRMCLTGVSAGGSGVWNVGSAYADRFAAIAPLCGNGGDMDRIAGVRLPVWNFINDGDQESLVEGSRRARDRLIKQGLSPLFTEFHAAGHDCWNATYRLPVLYGWLLEQRKSQNAICPRFVYLPADKLLIDWKQHGGAKWKAAESGVLVCANGREEGMLISNESGVDLELHTDVWAAAGVATEIALVPVPPAQADSELRIRLKSRDDGSSSISKEKKWFCGMSLAAEQSFKSQSWNDVRVRLMQNRLTVRINGWPAVDVAVDTELTGKTGDQSRYYFGLVSTSGEDASRWRYIRTRVLNSPAR